MRGIERILFFGTPCSFADRVLDALIDHGYTITAQATPGNRQATQPVQFHRAERNAGTGTRLPMAAATGDQHAPGATYDRLQINDHNHDTAVRTLAAYEADLVVVCCYPRRIPPNLIETARLGGVNVHPSLLPQYRGPLPLFWVFRNGETATGVTVHQVDGSLDTGPILRQSQIDVPVGTPGDELWDHSAKVGAELLTDSIPAIARGEDVPIPQDTRSASYYSRPTERDLIVDQKDWDARRVYHFCRGVLPFGYAPLIRQGRFLRRVNGIDGYVDDLERRGPVQAAWEWVTFRVGAVRACLGPPIF